MLPRQNSYVLSNRAAICVGVLFHTCHRKTCMMIGKVVDWVRAKGRVALGVSIRIHNERKNVFTPFYRF